MRSGDGLTQLQRDVLHCERELQGVRTGRTARIRARLGLSPVRYEQVLRSLIGVPAAMAEAPDVMHRLERRLQARHARQDGTSDREG
jgi:hypothetical protein